MMLASSIVSPESQASIEFNIQYPSAIDGDTIISLGPNGQQQTWVKYGGRWSVFEHGVTNEAFAPKRVIADLYRSFSTSVSSPSDLFVKSNQGKVWDYGVSLPDVQTVTTGTGIDSGKLALIGLIGFLLLRGAIK
jgi:hypothetical protein